jgi:hypothetical protein
MNRGFPGFRQRSSVSAFVRSYKTFNQVVLGSSPSGLTKKPKTYKSNPWRDGFWVTSRVTAVPIDHPATWGEAAKAVKTTFDAFRSAIGMIRDVASVGGGTKQQQQAIEKASVTAESSAAIAEAPVAQALGYELCTAHYPPVIMTLVGYFNFAHGGRREGDPDYECPECGYRTAGPLMYTRTAPARPADATTWTTMARKVRASRPSRAAEQDDYKTWLADAVAELQRQQNVNPSTIPMRVWRHLYIQGRSPHDAAQQAAVSAYNTLSVADRLRGRKR